MGALDDILKSYDALPAEQQGRIVAAAGKATAGMIWVPNPGPQTQAFFCEADELLYGGEPGGGKSDLGLGLAFTAHQRTLLLRRQYTDLSFLTERAIEINGTRDGFNGSPPPKLRARDGRLLDFGAAAKIGDEQHWMGNPHDLIVVDEATQFSRSQVRFLMGWLRSGDPHQRCRAILATNPALRPEGLWVNEAFAPWLDDRFPHPAKAGELRWYISDAGDVDRWVDSPGEYLITTDDGERMVQAKSRTYIPASMKDNPQYVDSGYQRQLDALPESVRRILLGGFKTTFKDAPDQIIPTAWVKAAQERWTARPPIGVPQCALGVDCSGGGDDPMVIASRHDGWFAPFEVIPGRSIPMDKAGRVAAGFVMAHRQPPAVMIIDMGGGYGGPLYEHLKKNFDENPEQPIPLVYPFKGSEGSVRRSRDGLIGFKNRRTEALWRMREALEPGQAGGSPIMLPDDNEMVADLTAPTFEIINNTYVAEPKEDVCARLGRSTDKGDAVCMCWSAGPTASTDGARWDQVRRSVEMGGRLGGRRPQVQMGRQPLTARRR